jgi:hypothetical protein
MGSSTPIATNYTVTPAPNQRNVQDSGGQHRVLCHTLYLAHGSALCRHGRSDTTLYLFQTHVGQNT